MTEPRTRDEQMMAPAHVSFGRARLFLPSIADFIFIAVFAVLTIGNWAPKLLWDTSTGWHIRAGELILRTHAIPRTDPFSYTMEGQPWYAWEWLWDALNGWIHVHFGLSGVVVLSAALIAATFGFLYRTLAERCLNSWNALLLTLLALAASSIHFLARPHVVSWLFVLLLLSQLNAVETGSRAAKWLIALQFALWSNLHGGFVLGFALVAIFALAALLERDFNLARRIATVLALCVPATVVNPYGLKLHAHVIRYLLSRVQMNNIDEFLSPDFHSLQPRLFLLIILLSLALLFAARKIQWRDLLLVLTGIAIGLLAARNIPVASILLAYAIAPHASEWLQSSRFQQLARRGGRLWHLERQSAWHSWAIATCIAAIAILALGFRLPGAHWDTKRVPAQAARYLVHDLGVRDGVFSPDYWGGYLIYTYSPIGFRVAVDDRSDLYGDTRFLQYLQLTQAGPNFQRVLDDWKVRYALVPTDSSMRSLLTASPEWRQAYADEIATIFVRTSARENPEASPGEKR